MHHVFARGVDRQLIFRDDADRLRYLDLLAYVVNEWHWDCLEYCLMSNHVHLVVRTAEPNLGHGKQRLHSLYATKFNQRHDRVGHLFQDRYGSSRIRACEKLAAIAAYVVQNPVSAGLCAVPAQWRWGSAGARAQGSIQWLASPRDAAGVYAALADPSESAAA